MHLLKRLQGLESRHAAVTNVRGRGLMCAFDLPHTAVRDQLLKECYEAGVVILGCGTRSIRFRTPLTINVAELDDGVDRIEAALLKTIGG